MKTRRKNKVTRQTFTKSNYVLFGIGIFILLIGYIALSQGPVAGFLSLSLAPVLLVLGYFVIIPIAIMFTNKEKTKE